MQPEIANHESVVRTIKIATCPSLTARSKLTYHIGCSADSVVYFRVVANSAAGAFNQDWVSLASIRQAFTRAKSEKALTSFYLHSLYVGKSVNTPAFLLAALKNEGLVQPSTTTRRCHEWTDGTKFLTEVKSLMASSGGPKVEDKSARGNAKKGAGGKVARPSQEEKSARPKASAKGKRK